MKKNLIKLLSAVALIAIIASCSSEEAKVKQVSEKYLRAYTSLDFEEAKKYATPESAKMIDLLSMVAVAPLKQMAADETKNKSFEFTKVEIKENDATVTYIVKDKAKKEDTAAKEETLFLKKVDGKWLVHQTKENSAPMDTDEDTTVDETEEVEVATPDTNTVVTTPVPVKK